MVRITEEQLQEIKRVLDEQGHNKATRQLLSQALQHAIDGNDSYFALDLVSLSFQ